jgi:hypothetical protein
VDDHRDDQGASGSRSVGADFLDAVSAFCRCGDDRLPRSVLLLARAGSTAGCR